MSGAQVAVWTTPAQVQWDYAVTQRARGAPVSLLRPGLPTLNGLGFVAQTTLPGLAGVFIRNQSIPTVRGPARRGPPRPTAQDVHAAGWPRRRRTPVRCVSLSRVAGGGTDLRPSCVCCVLCVLHAAPAQSNSAVMIELPGYLLCGDGANTVWPGAATGVHLCRASAP